MKHKRVPENSMTVRTYGELLTYAEAWATEKVNLLAIISTPGTGKSKLLETLAKTNRQPIHILNGHATAFQFYLECHSYRDELLVLDDVDTLYEDKKIRPLLKNLCDTDPIKHLAWHSKAIDDEGVPRKFATKSRVCVLCNHWGTAQAIADRALMLHFVPSAAEVHRRVGELDWADPKVFQFIGKHLAIIGTPSMRYYFHGAELKKMFPREWEDKTITMLNPDLDRRGMETLSRLLADRTLTDKQRLTSWMRATSMSRATYFRYKGLLDAASEKA